ncbi:MAG: redoxin domain-containing protein [Bacteroidota bacterium]
MKKLIYGGQTLLLLLLLTTSFESKSQNTGHSIKVKTGLKDTLCFLANYYGEKQYLQDSAKTDSKGYLEFKGKDKLPGGIYLFVFPNKTYFEMIVDKEQNFTMECEQSDVINSMKVKGSEENIKFYEYLQFIQKKSKDVEPLKTERKKKLDAKENTDELDKAIKEIDKSVIDYKKNYIATNPNTMLAKVFLASQDVDIPEAPLLANGAKDSTFGYRYYKEHYFDNFDLADERLLRTPIYHTKVSSYIKNMVLQIPDSLIKEADLLVKKSEGNKETFKYMVWYLTNTYETSNIMGLDAVFVHMANTYYTKEKAYWVDEVTLFKIRDRAAQLEPILLGKKVRNLILEDSTGSFQSLYNIKAKYTILFFYDPDCGHCKKSTPPLIDLYNRVKKQGVEVFAVCTEVEMDKWRAFIKEHKLEWINVADPKLHNNFRHEFDISTTPQIFLLDEDKRIIAKKIDVETLDKIVTKELEKDQAKKD